VFLFLLYINGLADLFREKLDIDMAASYLTFVLCVNSGTRLPSFITTIVCYCYQWAWHSVFQTLSTWQSF